MEAPPCAISCWSILYHHVWCLNPPALLIKSQQNQLLTEHPGGVAARYVSFWGRNLVGELYWLGKMRFWWEYLFIYLSIYIYTQCPDYLLSSSSPSASLASATLNAETGMGSNQYPCSWWYDNLCGLGIPWNTWVSGKDKWLQIVQLAKDGVFSPNYYNTYVHI